jgi:tRNA(Arg) A34 adenosine deaminase TadA
MENFMKAAIEEGVKGVQSSDGGPFGAVVVKNGQIIARGHNMVSLLDK